MQNKDAYRLLRLQERFGVELNIQMHQVSMGNNQDGFIVFRTDHYCFDEGLENAYEFFLEKMIRRELSEKITREMK